MCEFTFIGCIMVLAAHPRWDCVPPWNPFAPLAAIYSVVLHNFNLTAGAAAPLERFYGLAVKSSSNAGWLRSTPFDLAAYCIGFAGIHPANYSHIRSRC